MNHNEEKQLQPESAAPLGQKELTETHKVRGQRSGVVIGSLALAVSIALAGGLYQQGKGKIDQQQEQIFSLEEQVKASLTQNDHAIAQMQKMSEQQRQEITNQQTLLQSQVAALQTKLHDFDKMRPNDWMLAEAEYLLNLAARKLNLEHDIKSAVTLLADADQRIAALNDPTLTELRQTLAKDLAKMQALPAVDREGVVLKLSALSDQIELLPLNAVALPPAKSEAEQAISADWSDWKTNLQQNWLKFSENFITVRRRDGAVEALLSPQQEIYLRENLKNKLLQAQLAVYRDQQELFKDSVEKAQRWAGQYFLAEDSATRYLISELDKLQATTISVDYPDGLESPAQLKTVLDQRLQRLPLSN